MGAEGKGGRREGGGGAPERKTFDFKNSFLKLIRKIPEKKYIYILFLFVCFFLFSFVCFSKFPHNFGFLSLLSIFCCFRSPGGLFDVKLKKLNKRICNNMREKK